MTTRRTQDIDSHWKQRDAAAMSRKFDHLKGFLPEDFATVLDIGGGMGDLHASLSAWKEHPYTTVDLSSYAVSSMRERGIAAHEADADAGLLPFPDNSFDIVFATDVLEHLRNPWAVLSEMARVSRKYVFIYSPNFASLACRWDLLRGRPVRAMAMDKYGSVFDAKGRHVDHIYFLTYANVVHWAQKLGLRVVSARAFWYRRYAPFRWFLEPFFKNFGDVFEIVFIKDGASGRVDDPNFHFSQ